MQNVNKIIRLSAFAAVATFVSLVALSACANPSAGNAGGGEPVYTNTKGDVKYTLTVQLSRGRTEPEVGNKYTLTAKTSTSGKTSTGTIKTFYPAMSSGMASTFVLQPDAAGVSEFTVFTRDSSIIHIRNSITWNDGTSAQEPGSFTPTTPAYPTTPTPPTTPTNPTNPTNPTHTHSYSATWSFNATQHWRECTANDGAKDGSANHSGDPCTVCGYESDEPLVTFAPNNPLTANGNATTTTTELTLTFSAPIAGLSADDITLSGVAGVTKGTLSGAGPTYTLPISGFTAGGTLTVTVAKTGYNISGSHTVTIYYATPVTFSSLTANGSAAATTTELTLTFSAPIAGLSANDITLSGVAGVTKGTLSGAGPTYTLPISGFTAGGTLTVTVAKTGYNISASPKTVTIYYHVFTPEYSIGETGPGGGTIFYVSAAGFTVEMVNPAENYTAHYLEAAPNDMATPLAWTSDAFLPPLYDGPGWADIPGTAWAVGTGRKNTALILATDADAPAAKACNDYNAGGKTDWFLPSEEELERLFDASVGNMGTSPYWTSLQSTIGGARVRSFNSSGGSEKHILQSVRAVRAF